MSNKHQTSPGNTTQKAASSDQESVPLLGALDIHLIGEGRHQHIADCLGAHVIERQGVLGTRFAVWAPNASAVAVVGDFNDWREAAHPMKLLPDCGVWVLFIPEIQAGALYKFALRNHAGQGLPYKADPYARQTERPPATASVVSDPEEFAWTDDAWMAHRALKQAPNAPISIYEVHVDSWLRQSGSTSLWEEMGARLIDYAVEMGFTHLELLPITEHPFGGSWGYQPLGLYAPSARYGTPAQFAAFVDRCHAAGLGLILDWVPAHFPSDAHGLANFDGTALYEHADPRQGFHPDWNTLIYNLGRNEVRNFLVGSALEWLRRYHVDGLRVDAVASLLYLDYSRKAGEWLPNRHSGRENLESVQFLQALNTLIKQICPGALMIAEESTAWPGVTAAVEQGGLGFDYKWNMGWMHDTLRYMHLDPVHRRYHHNDMTFGMVYAYSEHFVLPLSHDEVVYGKGALIEKMPGDSWQRFANLRAYLGFMWTHPGKKLLFMGCELAQWQEWDHDGELDWACLHDAARARDARLPDTRGKVSDLAGNPHAGVQRLLGDLNMLYRQEPALHGSDTVPEGFAWVIGDDADNSVFAFLRRHHDRTVLMVSNMTPMPRRDYRIGVPKPGRWREAINTDAEHYGGSNVGNQGAAHTQAVVSHGYAQSLSLMLPPLATLVFIAEG
ncbi:1,4-alpha-glucan branching protein GlgB [Allopusillimonas ginsengisoli]|uniref:1,4-alpha-glucan branching protein GlgB n=1 Tax=Allopusillimonas ginsengisoli TaxID=453575 RepID=UPI0010213B16|nr:1,4-alpha-glucan branching protein GlgB [Allopusillimonas ginsengisoli]TEA77586.1 1,4-alpha-glucan branching protein GlgB [Allopusillimonas ginsengisoli]